MTVQFLTFACLITTAVVDVCAQMPTPNPPQAQDADDYTWWYIMLFVLFLGLIGAIGWWLSSKKAAKENEAKKKSAAASNQDAWENNSLDADKEMEWLRKNNAVLNRKNKKNGAKKKFPEGMPQPSKVFNNVAGNGEEEKAANVQETKTQLPVFSFQRIERARPFDNLPISNDDALLSAVEQTQEEYEEDEEIRDLSVKILAAFKTRNSVEALSQVALYDLSSGLRSKAVSILADFDHESVFESILLACADPTREVRAAAARGLTRLSFDRADAWARIIETGEEGRMRQAARAALEGGFVERIFDRLIHPDAKYAYEGVTLIALLVKAGETELLFEKLKTNCDYQLRQAILHVIKIADQQSVLNELYALLEQKGLSPDLKKMIDETIESIGLVAA